VKTGNHAYFFIIQTSPTRFTSNNVPLDRGFFNFVFCGSFFLTLLDFHNISNSSASSPKITSFILSSMEIDPEKDLFTDV